MENQNNNTSEISKAEETRKPSMLQTVKSLTGAIGKCSEQKWLDKRELEELTKMRDKLLNIVLGGLK